jgi:hypothetical protein
MTKQKRRRSQINKIRDKLRDITTNSEIHTIIREYFENIHSSKLENLHEMEKFLGAYDQPKWNQGDIKHLNNPITCNEVEAIIIQKEGNVPNSFYETNISQIPKLIKDTTRKENYRTISSMNVHAKILNKIPAKRIQQPVKSSYNKTKLVSFQGCKDGSTHINL